MATCRTSKTGKARQPSKQVDVNGLGRELKIAALIVVDLGQIEKTRPN